MIRVSVQARGLVKAGIESLLEETPAVQLVPDPAEAEILIAHVETELPAQLMSERMPPLIVLSDAPRREWLFAETQGSPVRAILPRNVQGGELAAAIQAVHAGLAVMHPESLRASEEVLAQPEIEPVLTPREIEVLRRVAEGSPNKIIAHELGISEHTVKFHVAQILSKLQAGSRTEAVTAGLRLGIVHL